MREEKKVSIIVPTYNCSEYIDGCMDTLLNQTYKNIEIILVDDGSPDRSGEICDAYAKKDSRIRVIHKIYNADFLRWLTSLFTDDIGLFEEMTVLFNHKAYETFTPRDMLHFVINGKVADNIKRFMQSDVYHKDLVSLPNYAEIASWQAIGTNASLDNRLDVYGKYKNPEYVEGGTKPEYISAHKKVLAVMHDDRVLSLTLKDRRTVTIVNEHGARRNVFEQGTVCNFVNLGHNSIVYYIDTVVKPVDIHLNKSATTIETGKTETLTADVNPNDATVVWGTSNSGVATVSNGTVTPVATGTCVISAIATSDGVSASDTCTVTIVAPANASTRKSTK